ncbi:c-type cytochrome [Roseinatronobacter alkalisoli]|uniref:Cytochrome C n=1 Tax=Roseinatronobacter alkalisoli TaxID=3028235 RepID=A0ABT5T996_9RHOB|nr:cytochrome C [Roseinatronobacter sp. HJB301]MDD7971693.1 cytochrome C [Roseinatronobacter sp. HJB301]
MLYLTAVNAEGGMVKQRRIFAATVLAFAALAPGVQAGERMWADCRTCHAVTAPDGTVLARGGRSGPNLYGIAGRVAGSDGDFRFYSDAMRAARNRSVSWTQDNFVAYLTNPEQFLQRATGNPDASAEMHVELRQGGAALFDYLRSLQQ